MQPAMQPYKNDQTVAHFINGNTVSIAGSKTANVFNPSLGTVARQVEPGRYRHREQSRGSRQSGAAGLGE